MWWTNDRKLQCDGVDRQQFKHLFPCVETIVFLVPRIMQEMVFPIPQIMEKIVLLPVPQIWEEMCVSLATDDGEHLVSRVTDHGETRACCFVPPSFFF